MYDYREPSARGYLSNIPPGVKYLLIINIAIFILQQLSAGGAPVYYGFLSQLFSLDFNDVVQAFYVWQIGSYMFLHGNFTHILFNMLALFMLGVPLESFWGTKKFIYYYLFCGLVAGLLIISIDFFKVLLAGHMLDLPPTLGASGAVFGLLLAYGLYYPNNKVLVFFVFPVKIKNFILWTIALSIVFIPLGFLSFISHSGHLGGILGGYLYHRFSKQDSRFHTGNDTLDRFFAVLRASVGLKARTSNVYSLEQKNVFEKIWGFIRKPFKGRGNSKQFSEADDLNETKMTDYEIEAKIDELLDKISLKGLRGLTLDEQLFLDRVSKLYRHKFPN